MRMSDWLSRISVSLARATSRQSQLPAGTRPKDRLLFVHGVWSRGAWYEAAVASLGRAFEVRRFKYYGYSIAGPFAVVFHPVGLGISAVLLLAAVSFMVLGAPWRLSASLYLTAIVAAAFSYARREMGARARWRALKRVLPDPSLPTTDNDVATHAIAHSFGTYLLVAGQREEPIRLLDRVVLLGTPLARRTSWSRLFEMTDLEHPRIGSIRNEIGLCDPIGRVGKFGARLGLKDFGSAGRLGFKTVDIIVHTRGDAWRECVDCLSAKDRAGVHNVRFWGDPHPADYRAGLHATTQWLPHLLCVGSGEFKVLIGLAMKLARLRPSSNPSPTNTLIRDVRTHRAALNKSLWAAARMALVKRDRNRLRSASPQERNDLTWQTLFGWGGLVIRAYFCIVDGPENPKRSQQIDFAVSMRLAAKRALR